MRKHPLARIFTIGLALFLSACNSSAERQKPGTENVVVADTISQTDTQAAAAPTDTQTNSSPAEDRREICVRGQATPLFNKTAFPSARFVLHPDSLTATETVEFANGDKLVVSNLGCEYYIISLRLETSRFQGDTSDIPYWYKSAATLATEVHQNIAAQNDMKGGIEKLKAHIAMDSLNNYSNLEFGQEIDYGGEEIRTYVTVESVEKLPGNKFAVTMSFTTGPL